MTTSRLAQLFSGRLNGGPTVKGSEIVQRYLYKWGGERLGRDAPEWRAFRSLFLEVSGQEVPDEPGVVADPSYVARWRRLMDVAPVDLAGVIRAIH